MHVASLGRNKFMRYSGLVLGFIILNTFFINATPVDPSALLKKKFASGRILVQPNAGLTDDKLNQILSGHGAKSQSQNRQIKLHTVQVPAGREEAIAAALSHNPNIKFAEVDGIIDLQPQAITDDPYLASQWHLSKIGAPQVWDFTTGTGVTIAILDTGVDGTHPDLAARMVPGWNFFDNNSNTADIYGHGTKVAGSAAAIGNNTLGVTGVAWNSKIMPMRISDPNGMLTYYSIVANSITWAADHGARVANISYGISHIASVLSAAQYMQSKGGVVVSAGGNSGGLVPGADTSAVLTVAATDSNDARTSWSSYGPIIDLSAPGAGIWTTTLGGGYGAVNGTSFSSPITAGVVALMLSANPALQPNQIDSLLKSTAVDRGAAGRDDYYGYGRVDAANAIQAARAAVTNDSQAPSVSISNPLAGARISGLWPVTVSASDNIGVSRVELYAGGSLIAMSSQSPYQFSLDTTGLPEGSLTLTAKAFDAAGNAESSSISVTVNNIVDTTAPVITSLTPANGSILKGTVTISASASDNIGVTSMVIYVDGVQKATSSSGSISFNLNSRKMTSGTHTIRVDAKDGSGHVGTKSVLVTK